MSDSHHAPWTDHLPHYVAGTLAATERAALEQHLAGCADCRSALHEWELIAAAVHAQTAQRANMPLPTLPNLPHLARNGRQKLTQEPRLMTISPASPISPTSSSAPAYPASTTRRHFPSITLAAVLLMVFFGGILMALSARGDQDPNINSAGNTLRLTTTSTPTVTAVLPSSTPIVIMTPTPIYIYLPSTPTPLAPEPSPTPIREFVIPSKVPIQTMGQSSSLPNSVKLDGIRHEQQGWNNQGPTTLAMALSYWGWQGNQTDTARWLKPDLEDKSVSPQQITYYTNQFTDYNALNRMGGTIDLMKRLLAAGFPVIARQSIQPTTDDWMGHYVLLMGYEQDAQQFLTFDSYRGYNQGNGRPSPYDVFDERWRHFNRTFIVVYDPAIEYELRTILGEYADPTQAATYALEAAWLEASQNRNDKWAWFNMGTAYVALGDYGSAAIAYDQALQMSMPWRILWYQFGPFEAYFRTGEYNTVLTLANATYATTQYVEEVYYWQLMVYLATNPLPAEQAFGRLMNANPNYLIALIDEYHLEGGLAHLPAGYETIPNFLPGMIGSTPIPIPTPTSTPPADEATETD